MEQQEYVEKCHNFGNIGWHQPRNLPDNYYLEGCAICPPQPNNRDKHFFPREADVYYYFMGLDFVYIGRRTTQEGRSERSPTGS
eukprot:15185241-Heterocapsa_arctica.AAC.1